MSRLERLQALLAREADDVFLNFSLGMELAKAERWDECLARFSRVIELDSGYVAAYFHKGKTLLKLRRFAEAKATLEQGVIQADRAGDAHAKSQMEQLLAAL
jgi:lipoprotein NlpI